jgi:hypothetical protein
MIDQISGSTSMSGLSNLFEAKTLTDEQKTKIEEILSNYDADSITADDAKEIFEAFKEAGITPSKGMKEAIDAAGFDAEELRSLAGFDQAGPPPPPPSSEIQSTSTSTSLNSSTLQSLQTILNDYDLTALSEDQQSELLTRLQDAGLLQYTSGLSIDISA